MAEFRDVAAVEDLPEGGQMEVRAGGREIGLFHVEGQICAIDNVCLHRGGPLADGALEGCVVSCPFHAWTFDVRTGICTFNDDIRQETFETRVQDGRIWVKV
ncbi:MAG TPA: Rieske 2Fe-2S domain-containing protein [Acidobacteriota bacterium]|nr:Rieske 2Fe-2S domain-containing protein [Acidobacteriota bacterium]